MKDLLGGIPDYVSSPMEKKINFELFRDLLSDKFGYENNVISNIIFNINHSNEKIKKEAENKIRNLDQKDLPEVAIVSAKKFFDRLSVVQKFGDNKNDPFYITLEQIDSITELNNNSRAILLQCLNIILKRQLKNNFSNLNKFIDDDFRIIVDYEKFGEDGVKIKQKTQELHEQFKNDKKNITNPELFEIFKTCVLNEFLGENKYLTSRSSLSDDYISGVDNVIFNTDTNKVMFAFDELVQYGVDRLDEKDEIIEKRNRFGGAFPMFIPKKINIDGVDYIDIEYNKIKEKYPIFCLYIDKEELLTGIKLIIKKYLLDQQGDDYSSQLKTLKNAFMLKFREEIKKQQKYIADKNKLADINEFIELLN